MADGKDEQIVVKLVPIDKGLKDHFLSTSLTFSSSVVRHG
jgi:hypothetical protein